MNRVLITTELLTVSKHIYKSCHAGEDQYCHNILARVHLSRLYNVNDSIIQGLKARAQKDNIDWHSSESIIAILPFLIK